MIMKKEMKSLVIALLTITLMIVVGCSKNDESSSNVKKTESENITTIDQPDSSGSIDERVSPNDMTESDDESNSEEPTSVDSSENQ